MTKSIYSKLAYSGLVAALCLAGCQNKESSTASTKVATAAPALTTAGANTVAKSPKGNPDFGGVSSQHVEVTATGPTLETAVDNAIRLAIEQVNGKRVDAATLQLGSGESRQANNVGSPAYANLVASATSGAVSHFQLLSQKQINTPKSSDEEALKASQGASWNKGKVDASATANASADDASASVKEGVKGAWDQQQGASQVDYHGKHTDFTTEWQVRIAADVATYREAASAKLTRVIVAMPEVSGPAYHIGDNTVSSDAIASEIRSKVSEALTQTHRFTVLDRSSDAQIKQEIGLIQSGNATVADTARLGQQLAADLIVIPTIDRFEYLRRERELRMADRSLVSYSGGGEVSFRVVNAATGQQVMSQSFKYAFPETAPTTLGVSVDGSKLASDMMDAVDRDIVSAILRSTYPLSVLQLQGRNVVINQGGEAVQQGATYQVVTLGKALIDPQSGQSLGPTETPCCSVTIDRVTPNLSYGHIDGDELHLATPFVAGSLELRGQVVLAASSPSTKELSSRHHSSAPALPHTKPKPASDSNW